MLLSILYKCVLVLCSLLLYLLLCLLLLLLFFWVKCHLPWSKRGGKRGGEKKVDLNEDSPMEFLSVFDHFGHIMGVIWGVLMAFYGHYRANMRIYD